MTIEHTLTTRSHRYGDFKGRARIADALILICEGRHDVLTNFSTLSSDKKHAIREICDILSRIISPLGNPEYRGNWNDIQGYAALAENGCQDGDETQTELDLGENVHRLGG